MAHKARSIAVSQTAHTGHNAKHVVVHGIDINGVNGVGLTGSEGNLVTEVQLSVVNARKVASTAGLVFLRAKAEGVHSDGIAGTSGTEASVGVEDLVSGEVLDIALGKAIGTVKDDLGGNGAHGSVGINGGSGLGTDNGGWGSTRDAVKVVGGDGSGSDGAAGLSAKDDFLNGVVKVEADGGSGGRLGLVLQLVDEVLVSVLGELSALSGVEVDVVGIHLDAAKVRHGGNA